MAIENQQTRTKELMQIDDDYKHDSYTYSVMLHRASQNSYIQVLFGLSKSTLKVSNFSQL